MMEQWVIAGIWVIAAILLGIMWGIHLIAGILVVIEEKLDKSEKKD